MGYLSNEEFFSRLGDLFDTQKGKEHGAIYLSQRRLVRGEENSPDMHTLSTSADAPRSLIIRASNGKSKKFRKEKIRLSTTVDSDALEAFYAKYAETCKAGMTLLKPRDKSKKKAKAKKKKAATTSTAS